MQHRIAPARALRFVLITAMVAGLFAVVQPASAATTWRVNGQGSGCNGSTCKTLADALGKARSGDTVEIIGGSHVSTVIDVNGVTIRGNGGTLKGATKVTGQNITLRQISAEGALFIEPSAQGIVVDQLRAKDFFLGIEGARNVTVRNSTLDGKDNFDILNITNGARDVLIERNRLEGAWITKEAERQARADIPHVDCVQMFGGGQNITFRRNVIGDCDMSAFMIKSDRGALRNVVLERNFIAECAPVRDACNAPYAIQIHAGNDAHWTEDQPKNADAYYPLEGLVLRQNTIDGGVILGNKFIGKMQIVGNIITSGDQSKNKAIEGECGNHNIQNNVFGDNVACKGYSKGSNVVGAVKFANRNNIDLHLAKGSAGREFGSPHAAAAGSDIDGHAVCGKADAGADEGCANDGPPPPAGEDPPPPPSNDKDSGNSGKKPSNSGNKGGNSGNKGGGGGGGGVGAPGGQKQFVDTVGNSHNANISKIATKGITTGCSPDGLRYCPSALISRGQMAAFFVRALKLPPAPRDYFSDDNGTVFNDAINRVAAAGITAGFKDGTFKPEWPVTREHMATMIARAWKWAPVAGNRFADVSGPHAGNINAIAAKGITQGCNADGKYFCPQRLVKRDEMASFIGRAVDHPAPAR